MRLLRSVERPESAMAAELLQSQLAESLVLCDDSGPAARLIAATDVAYTHDDQRAFAAVVVVDREQNYAVVDQASWAGPPPYPYEPGLFAFREAACLIPALEALQTTPDLIFVDGQGVAHPRRFGIACHIGWLFDVPTLGCAKTRLHGEPVGALAAARGSHVALQDNGETIGYVLRSQDNIKPLYVSPGHRMSFSRSVALVLEACTTYRIPEPLRAAHHLSITLRAAPQTHEI